MTPAPAGAATSRGPVDPRLLRRASATVRFLIACVVAGTATAVLVVCQAWLLSGAVVSVAGTRSLAGVPTALAWLAVVLLARAALSYGTTWLAHRSAAAVKSQLRTDILAARLADPLASSTSSAELLTLVTQGLDALDGYFSKYLPQLVLAVTVPVVVGAAVLWADWQAAAIMAVTLPLIPLFMALVGWTTEATVRRRWRYQSRLARHFADLVAGLPTLQVFGRARAQAEGLRRTEESNRTETLRTLRVSFLSAFVLELLSTLAVAVVALTVGTRLVYFGIDFRWALFVLILAPEVYLPVRQVGVHYHDSADGVAAAEAAFAQIDAATPARVTAAGAVRPLPVPSAGPLVDVRGVAKAFGPRQVLAPVSFTVAPGEVVALAGPSGCGKSTLLTVLLGLLPPTEGAVVIEGLALSDWDPRAWRRLVAYVPQTPGMIAGTVAANVRLGWPHATDADVRDALARSGASGLEPARTVGDDGEGLSAGERRRVGLARALVRITQGGARLVVLDEPTAGLDADAEATVLGTVRRSGAAALVVSHRRAVLEAADRVVRLDLPAGVPS